MAGKPVRRWARSPLSISAHVFLSLSKKNVGIFLKPDLQSHEIAKKTRLLISIISFFIIIRGKKRFIETDPSTTFLTSKVEGGRRRTLIFIFFQSDDRVEI